MSESCSLDAHVENSKGEVVKSRFFEDLSNYFSNRETAKQHYNVGTSQDFLNRVGSRAKFDSNNQITIDSYFKLTGINEPEAKIIENLNKQIGVGTYEYSEAMSRLQSFNTSSGFKDSYMATISYNDGKYNLSVVKKNKANEIKLENTIYNQTRQDRLIFWLKQHGVNVTFLEDGSRSSGRYSTKNVSRTIEGLYNLIEIANGNRNSDAALAEVSGHFAVASLSDHALIQRLMKMLTPEVQKILFNKKILDAEDFDVKNVKELAGKLVGKALYQEMDKKAPWQKMLIRAKDYILAFFKGFKNDHKFKDSINAIRVKSDAAKIASGFMSYRFEGDVETAINSEETVKSDISVYYDINPTKTVKTYNNIQKYFKIMLSQLKSKQTGNLEAAVKLISSETFNSRDEEIQKGNLFSDNAAKEGIVVALQGLLDLIGPGKEVNRLFENLNFDTSDFMDRMSEYAKNIRQAGIFYKNCLLILEIAEDYITSPSGSSDPEGEFVVIRDSFNQETKVNLRSLTRSLRNSLVDMSKILRAVEFEYFKRFCEDSYGSKYIKEAAKIVFNYNKKTNYGLSGKFIDKRQERTLSIEDLLRTMDSDISLFQRFISSMSNNGDIIGQIVDTVTKLANKNADDLTNAFHDKLVIMRDTWVNKLGRNQRDASILYERDRNGNFTGNIISNLKYGDWENDFAKFKRKALEDFKKSDKNPGTESEVAFGLAWSAYFKPLYKEWHKKHSIFNAETSRWEPNSKSAPNKVDYTNTEFDNIKKDKDLYNFYLDYINLKSEIDSYLPEGSTTPYRLPQFKGTFTNKYRNANVKGSKIQSFASSLRSNILENFCESSDDTDFGSDEFYNDGNPAPIYNPIEDEKERVNRLPLFGINKLQDMNELSTNIFQSTLAYAGMASSYACLNTIVDSFEVGKNVLSRRTGGDKTRAYTRFVKFLDQQVYGVRSTKTKLGKNVILEKCTSTLTSIASKYFLNGNIAGATVNLGTGFIEILKEASSSEFFSIKDLLKAHELYFKDIPEMWKDGVFYNNQKDSRTALLVRHFNILGDNKASQREWNNHRALYNTLGGSLMMPYKTGDHYMQCMSYLALASSTKLYTKEGGKIKEVSLYDAYEVVDNEDENSNYGKTLKMIKPYFKNKDSFATYDLISSIKDKVLKQTDGNPLGIDKTADFTEDEFNFLKSKSLDVNRDSKKKILHILNIESSSLIWTTNDDSAFMDRAREINNRLHGIYNKQDKTTMHANLYGNMLLAMKGWVLGNAERLFAPSHYSIALGKEVEGSLNTFAKVILSTFAEKQGIKQLGWTIGCHLGLTGDTRNEYKQKLIASGYSENQVANMRRTWSDFIVMGLLAVLEGLFKYGGEDDDEPWEVGLGVLYYFAHRLYREQEALRLPTGWLAEKSTLLDLTPTGVSALIDMVNFADEFVGSAVADKDNPNYYYQASNYRHDKGDPKWQQHLFRMTPYLRSYYVFKNPFESVESYEFGRKYKR